MSTVSNYTLDNYFCSDKGLLLPFINEFTWHKYVRAFLYFFGMLWCFMGVAIVSDTFVCSIEHITSKTRSITVPKSDGSGNKVIEVKIWNDTVANLTLLAFGTSAPEILLSVIEIVGHKFVAGELGPGTIVGSAAFNLYVITAVCILSIPDGETRRIKNYMVFIVTTTFGVFAYVWLILVLVVITPEVVDLWEALVTLLLFPALIMIALAADKQIYRKKKVKTSVDTEIGFDLDTADLRETGSSEILKFARALAKNKGISEDEAAKLVAAKIAENTPKPSGWYRVQATRVFTGGHRLARQSGGAFADLVDKVKTMPNQMVNTGLYSPYLIYPQDRAVIEFVTSTSAVLETEGHVRIGIKREGDMSKEVSIGIETNDGTAHANSDYVPINQLLSFGPGEKGKTVYVDILHDGVWERDEFFFVKLYYHPLGSTSQDLIIGKISVNQVTIISVDEPGRLEWSKPSYIVKESIGDAQLVINRTSGVDGEVKVTWTTRDMTAKSAQEYIGGQGVVTFKHGETSKIISIEILAIGENRHESNFQVELSNPTGGATIGRIPKTIVTIINDEEFNGMLSRIANKTQKNLDGLKLETSTWGEQFRTAMNVNGGDQEGAIAIDYVLHFISFFWKVLFAFIPPTCYCDGWLTFCISLFAIGFITAIVSDLASIFGCLVGLSDYITAITFVALGTSMPDTFASKSAALNEKWADSSIGNINGSNSVNVFLGLGLPWFFASVYWHSKGKVFHYPTGSLGLSVALFTVGAIIVIGMLVCRRNMEIFGKAELGGPKLLKYLSACLAISIWLVYIILSSLQAQGLLNSGI